MSRRDEQSGRDIAVLGVADAYIGSLGMLLDSMAMIQRHVAGVFAASPQFELHAHLHLLSMDGASIPLAGGRSMAVDGAPVPGKRYQVVYLPAFEADSAEALARRLAQQGPLLAWLRQQRSSGALVAAAGASVLLLAEAGLLAGASASVTPELAGFFRSRYPGIRIDTRSPLLEHAGILTAGQAANEWQLANRLVESAFSPRTARWLAAMVGCASASHEGPVLADDPLVASAQVWLLQHFNGKQSIGDLARQLAISHHTLIRRFSRSLDTTPRQYRQRLRVDAAKNMLLRSRHSVTDIGAMLGYADARAFRVVFTAYAGVSPSAFRRCGNESLK